MKDGAEGIKSKIHRNPLYSIAIGITDLRI